MLTKRIMTFVGLIVILILGYAIAMKYLSTENNVTRVDQNIKEVLDCSNDDVPCTLKQINSTIVNCVPWKEPRDCEETTEGLQQVNLIADETNYISKPFTDQKFTAEIMPMLLDTPREVDFFPDGSILVAQRDGTILHLVEGTSKILYKVPDVYIPEESLIPGLNGLAVDPDFETNQTLYIYYTYELDASESEKEFKSAGHKKVHNRLSRLKMKNDVVLEETVLIDRIPGSFWHSGGRLKFGPDGKLYLTTGEANEFSLSQDIDFLGGKILRVNTDGSIPVDNPYPDSYVYSMGHRNPQGIAWHPITGELYASEHGPWRYDEVNLIRSGLNYGWGTKQCDEPMDDPSGNKVELKVEVKTPVICTKSWTLAPSGIDFVSDKNNPWYESLFVASLRGKHMHRYTFKDGVVEVDEIFFVPDRDLEPDFASKISKRIRSVRYYGGSLYLIGDQKGLVRITPKSF